MKDCNAKGVGEPQLPPSAPGAVCSAGGRAPQRRPCLTAAGAAEWKGRNTAIGRQQRGRAFIGQREGAGPPSGMYYGVSGTSVPGGRARTLPGAREGCAYCNEGWGVQASRPVTCAPASRADERLERASADAH